jgi:hypothetical protein
MLRFVAPPLVVCGEVTYARETDHLLFCGATFVRVSR